MIFHIEYINHMYIQGVIRVMKIWQTYGSSDPSLCVSGKISHLWHLIGSSGCSAKEPIQPGLCQRLYDPHPCFDGAYTCQKCVDCLNLGWNQFYIGLRTVFIWNGIIINNCTMHMFSASFYSLYRYLVFSSKSYAYQHFDQLLHTSFVFLIDVSNTLMVVLEHFKFVKFISVCFIELAFPGGRPIYFNIFILNTRHNRHQYGLVPSSRFPLYMKIAITINSNCRLNIIFQ